MKRKLVLVMTAIAAVSAIGSIGYFVWLKNFSGVAVAEKAVKRNLLDPDSAKFSVTFYNSKTGNACGLVNSKNRMGGYAGETQFIAKKDGTVTFESKEGEDSENPTVKVEYLKKQLAFLNETAAACNDPIAPKN